MWDFQIDCSTHEKVTYLMKNVFSPRVMVEVLSEKKKKCMKLSLP